MASRNVRLYHKIAERKLGRRLLPFEVIHHKDEDPTNNSPDNLEVMTAADHAILHGRAAKARGYHQFFMIDKAEADPVDIFWSRLREIDLSEIAL